MQPLPSWIYPARQAYARHHRVRHSQIWILPGRIPAKDKGLDTNGNK